MNSFVTIQNAVNAFIDSTKDQNAPAGKLPIPGVKQALEKKEGLFRKHMMGKRVNYAARSVISPDPMLETNEIGVPPVFAKKLTYPEPVTSYNASELRQAVINGPDQWPGAIQVQNEDGSLQSLIGMTLEQRKTIANQLLTPSNDSSVVNKKVYRHIKNKDVVIMNRQPTLHKASMMGHKLIYGCIRPEDGHTNGNSRILTVPPAIFKPEALWTGKQVITTILLNIKPKNVPGINLNSKNKIKNDYWGEGSNENQVVFKNGELLCGILDKSQYGASQFGIVHSLHEVYGSDVAGKALSVLGRLFTNYITMTAFTCGMDDLRLTKEGNEWRNEILKESVDIGRVAATEVTNLEKDTKNDNKELLKRLEEILRDDDKLGILDAVTQSKVNVISGQVVNKCVPEGTMKRFPYNNMQSMALSGAKGSNVNKL
ncbi:hypothetical protein QCA50_012304 [Cerrena zonata]|uniref:DNA-directed RNA polymerase n=1 Tax=Cerrena zonata TaxID=2478898 RepID=A0AAW0G4T9_9APHY